MNENTTTNAVNNPANDVQEVHVVDNPFAPGEYLPSTLTAIPRGMYNADLLLGSGIESTVLVKDGITIDEEQRFFLSEPDEPKMLADMVNVPFIPVAVHFEEIAINTKDGGKVPAPKVTFLTDKGEYVLCTSTTAYASLGKVCDAYGKFNEWKPNLQLTAKMTKSGEKTFYKFIPSYAPTTKK